MNVWIRNNFFKIIGILEIIGGIYGCISMCVYLFRSQPLLFLFFIIPFIVLSFTAGYFLLLGHPKGFLFSIILQALSIISVHSSFITYVFYSGAKFILGISFGTTIGLSFNFYLGAFNLEFLIDSNPTDRVAFDLGINILAVWFLVYLNHERKRRFQHQQN